MLGSLPDGERLVSPGGGRRLARSGLLDLRSEAEFASALRADTRMLQALGFTDELEIENGLFSS
jgi:hypothetical protein